MSERLERRDQVDEAGGGVGVELAQRGRVERRGAGADLRVPAKAEGVLHVQHQDVQLEPHAEIDERVQGRQRRHLAARDVEHDPAPGEVGSILDAARGQEAARVDELGERLDGVAQAGRPRGREARPVRGHRDAMGLARSALAVQLDPRAEIRHPRVGLDGELRAASRADGVAQPRRPRRNPRRSRPGRARSAGRRGARGGRRAARRAVVRGAAAEAPRPDRRAPSRGSLASEARSEPRRAEAEARLCPRRNRQARKE